MVLSQKTQTLIPVNINEFTVLERDDYITLSHPITKITVLHGVFEAAALFLESLWPSNDVPQINISYMSSQWK